MSERKRLVKDLKELMEDIEIKEHMWAEDYTAYKVTRAFRIILKLLGEEVEECE